MSAAPRRRTAARLVLPVAAAALVGAGLVGVPGTAGADVTLTPPPLPWYTCDTNGSGTICHGKTDFTDLGGYDGTCPQGFDILENGHHDEIGHRYYDRDGFLVRRDLHDTWSAADPLNVFYNSVTGKSIPYSADGTEHDVFGVPGDFDSITATFTGKGYNATLPGSGLLVHDGGLLRFSPDGVVLADHGPRMLFDGDIAKLCAALAGP